MILASLILALAASSEIGDARIYKTYAIAHMKTGPLRPPDVIWKRVPTASEIKAVLAPSAVRMNYLDALCGMSKSGRLKDCAIREASPPDGAVRRMFSALLSKYQADVAATSGGFKIDKVTIRIRLDVQGAPDGNFCMAPFCNIIPPPPAPPPPSPQSPQT